MESIILFNINNVTRPVNQITDPEAKRLKELRAGLDAVREMRMTLDRMITYSEEKYTMESVVVCDIDDGSPSVNQINTDLEAKRLSELMAGLDAIEEMRMKVDQMMINYSKENKYLQNEKREKDEKKIFNITAFCTRIRNFFK